MNLRHDALAGIVSRLQTAAPDVAWLTPAGHAAAKPRQFPVGILPGSFNPLHAGHVGLRHAAAAFLGGPVCFELTITNADKPPLAAAVVAERLRQFQSAVDAIAVTSAATFAEKARLFRGAALVVGFDTAERILQPRFYGGRGKALAAALNDVQEAGCRFLVAGRQAGETFKQRRHLDVPAGFGGLFVELPAEQFRADVSSTALRGES